MPVIADATARLMNGSWTVRAGFGRSVESAWR